MDSGVHHPDEVAAGVRPNVEVVALDRGDDALAQMVRAVGGREDVGAIHVVAHGSPGRVEFSSGALSWERLDERADALAALGSALGHDGELLLWTCRTGDGAVGASFVESLARATGARVGASAGLVGSGALGGSWDLEGASSRADAASPFTVRFMSDYPAVLAIDGQLWFGTGLGSQEVSGHINSDGSSPTQLHTSSSIPVTDIAVDTAAGLYWVVDSTTGSGSGDPNACSIIEYRISDNSVVGTLQIGDPTDLDAVNAVVVDPVSHTLYVSQWGFDQAHSGIEKVTYNPSTGAMTGGFSNPDFLVNNANFSGLDDVRYMSLDRLNHKLYFTDNDNGYSLSPFHPTNGVFVVDLSSSNPVPVQLTSNADTAGGFPTGPGVGSGGGTALTDDPRGLLGAVAIDSADNLVFFLTHQFAEGGPSTDQDTLWYVSATGGAGQIATKVTLPAGVTLNYPGEAGGLSFDPQTRQLYISDWNQSASNASHILVGQLSADGHSITSIVQTLDMKTLTGSSSPDQNDAPMGTSFNNIPILSVTGTSSHVVEQGAAVGLQSSFSATDVDGGYFASASVVVSGGTFAGDGDVLAAATAGTSITANYNSATETLTLSGYDTIAHYQQVMQSVTLQSNADNPTNYGADTTRTITWTVSDGTPNIPSGQQNSGQTTVTIDAVNDPPSLASVASSAAYTEQAAGTTLAAALTVADPDNLDLNGATVMISSGLLAGDVLSASTAGTSITANYASGVLTLSGSDTLAHYQQVLRSVAFSSSSDNPTNYGVDNSRTITWQVDDGQASNHASNTPTTTVNVTPVDDAPTAATTAGTTASTAGTAIAVDTGVTVGDVDNLTLPSATVSVTGNFQTGEDVLVFTNDGSTMGDISASYNSGTGVLTLTSASGTATLAEWRSALDSVTYEDTSGSPNTSDRTISFVVNDGTLSSLAATKTVSVAANQPDVAHNDAFTTDEATAIGAGQNVFNDNGSGADSGPGLSVVAVNGSAAAVGVQTTLASGALLTLNADGTFTYDPNHAFDTTPAAGSGASNTPAHDSFTYTLNGGSTATVNITVDGLDTNDVLIGTPGDDTLNGGVGADTMYGGLGRDTYIVDNPGDVIVEAKGGGYDQVFSSVSYVLPNYVEKLILTGSGDLNGTGNNASNVLVGNSGANVLTDGSGNDVLKGGAGDDTLYGGAGADSLSGGTGADSMAGGLGNDSYWVDNPGDVVSEAVNGGVDTVHASISYTLTDNVENLILSGGASINGTGNVLDNTITGNAKANVLSGEAGDDTLAGGGGADTLTGGAGHDTFVFNTKLSAANNVDTITDFTVGDDRIDLSHAVFAALGTGALAASAFYVGAAAVNANQHIIYDSATGNLFYDPDGSGAAASVQFAHLTAGLALTQNDFFVT